MIWPDGHACIKEPWLGWCQSVGEPWFPMGPSKILGGCDVRSQEFVPVQSCHISCQLAMSQSESAYSATADWHWTTSNTPEVAIRAPYGDMGTSQRRNGDVRTWWHVGKIGPRSQFFVVPFWQRDQSQGSPKTKNSTDLGQFVALRDPNSLSKNDINKKCPTFHRPGGANWPGRRRALKPQQTNRPLPQNHRKNDGSWYFWCRR